MTAFNTLFGGLALVWLCGLAAGFLALGWSVAVRRRLGLALVMAFLAIAAGWVGMRFFHFRYSKTVNGSGWSIDSEWFFLAPLCLGVVSLAVVIWKWRKFRHAN